MSFTEDELQAFNSILEQRLAAHRQEITQALDQHLESFREKIEQQFVALQQEVAGATVGEKLSEQREQVAALGRTLDERLTTLGSSLQHLDERLVSFSDALQLAVKNLEQQLATRLHGVRDDLASLQRARQAYGNGQLNSGTSVQEVLAGVEHLEHIMESMQVAMTANHALLSNRLYHHQQLPLERAHPNTSGQTHVAPANGVGSLLAQAKERLASGLEPEIPARKSESEGSVGQ